MRVDAAELTPTVANALLRSRKHAPGLKVLLTIGEMLTQPVINEFGGSPEESGILHGLYGPTEAAIHCTIAPDLSTDSKRGIIGRPLSTVSAFIVTAGARPLQVLPIGQIGELAIGGFQLANGYINRPDQDEVAFLEHKEFGRLYLTGDMARLLPGNVLECLGRISSGQVKLRGQRVELEEIQQVVLQMQEIQMAIVTVIEDVLIAFCVTHDSTVNADLVWQTCERWLPRYMIPVDVVLLDGVPRLPSGKLDLNTLRENYLHTQRGSKPLSPDRSKPGEDVGRRETETEGKEVANMELHRPVRDGGFQSIDSHSVVLASFEEQITKVLRHIVSDERSSLDREASLFSFGINSLTAIPFARELRVMFPGVAIDVSSILRNPSIARLASFMSQPSRNTFAKEGTEDSIFNVFSESSLASIRTAFPDAEKILPCTPLQEVMLSASSTDCDQSYVNRTVFETVSNVPRLRHAWGSMIKRHELLRTSFTATNQRAHVFAQVVLASVELPWTTTSDAMDIQSLLKGSHETTAQASHSKSLPWAICEAPSQDGSPGTQLVLTMHHALYDAIAIERLLWEVEQSYKCVSLPDAPLFDPFLRWMLSASHQSIQGYWSAMLGNYTPSLFETDGRHGSKRGTSLSRLRLPMSLKQIDTHCKTLSTTLSSICQASWAKVIMARLSKNDVCFGNVVSGRSAPIEDVESLVAPCFNTIPIRATVSSNTDNITVVRNLQRLNVESLPHQLSSLRTIQSKCSPDGRRLFDTVLLLQHPQRCLDDSIWVQKSDYGQIDFPIVCEIQPEPVHDSLTVSLHCQEFVPWHKELPSLLEEFQEAFRTCLEKPHDIFKQSGSHTLPSRATLQAEQGREISYGPVPEDTATSQAHGQIVRQILAQLSGRDERSMGAETTIFRLGLDSINAVQIAARLRDAGSDISTADVLEHPSLLGLTRLLREKYTGLAGDEDKKETCVGRTSDLLDFDRKWRAFTRKTFDLSDLTIQCVRPCTPMQDGMLAQTVHTEGGLYLNQMTYKLSDSVDIEKLFKAWTVVVEYHEVLRSGFIGIDDMRFAFAMVTYKSLGAQSCLMKDEANFFHLPDVRASQRDIVRSLHRPAWRLSIVEYPDGRRMCLMIHHALYDAYSLNSILSDLQRVYMGNALTTDPRLDPAIIYITAPAAEAHEAAKTFWHQHAQLVSRTSFPNLQPLRGAVERFQSVSSLAAVPSKDMDALCASANTTIQAVGQAAWARVLAAYSGEDVVTFGTVYSGRLTKETELSALPCIFTQPMTLDAAQDDTSLLQCVADFNVAAQRHGRVSLAKIQKWTGLEGQQIFDTLFVYQKPYTKFENIELWTLEKEDAFVEYRLSLEVLPCYDEKLMYRLTFDAAYLPPEQARLILTQFEFALQSILSPEAKLQLIDYDPQIFSTLPAREIELASDIKTVHGFVERSAESMPHSIALEFVSHISLKGPRSRTWTYRQLNTHGNKIANLIIDREIQQGSIVAVCFEKCPEAYFAILGILKAGCSFLALDSDAPLPRQQFILADSNSPLLLTQSSLSIAVEGAPSQPLVLLDQVNMAELSGAAPILKRQVQAQDLAYVLYTSGTTGTPKGCKLSHENIVQVFMAFQRLYRHTRGSRFLQFAAFHFDVSVMEQYWSWSVGICVVAVPRDVILQDIPEALRQLQITHVDLTPSLAQMIRPEHVPSLCQEDSVFITGGEAIKQDIIDTWGPRRVIHNAYGPTEVSIGLSMNVRLSPDAKTSNIGKQFDNVGCYVFKPGTLRPVFRGAIGELCVCGKLVAQGYLDRSDLTAQKFPVIDGITGRERLYRTGDLVRVFYDDSFEFLGRADDQVKLRGQRLEISEINSVIKQSNEEILDVATLMLKHHNQQKAQIVSFVALSGSPNLEVDGSRGITDRLVYRMNAVRARCRSRLPTYSVPTHVIPLQRLPLSNNNKADHRRLKQLFETLSLETLHSLSSDNRGGTSLSSTAELRVLEVLSLVNASSLLPADVKRTSSIFELGLDSIAAIGFARSLKKSGFHNATPTIVMQHPVIGDLARILESSSIDLHQADGEVKAAKLAIAACQQRYRSTAAKALDVTREEIECLAPCTPLQQGMISEALSSDKPLYFSAFHYAMLPKVDLNRLKSACEHLVQALQILRTRFVATERGHVQVVLKGIPLPWIEEEIHGGDDLQTSLESRRASWWEHNVDHLLRPFEFRLIKLPDRTLLVLHIFHALYDGNSLDMMRLLLLGLYHREPDAKDIGPSFHSALPFGPLRSSSGTANFWRERLQVRSDVTKDSIVPDASLHDIATSRVLRDCTHLERCRTQLATTHQAMFQACWIAVLQKVFKMPVTLGMIVSGRSIDLEGAEKVVGPLFNTVPFNVPLADTMTWVDAVNLCHRANAEILPYQHTPLRDINKALGSGNEVQIQSLLVFQKGTHDPVELEPLWEFLGSTSDATYPVALEIEQRGLDDFEITLVTRGGFLNAKACEEMLDDFEHALHSLLESGKSQIGEGIDIKAASQKMLDLSRSPSEDATKSEAANVHDTPEQWDSKTTEIRMQMASLANVEHDNISLITSIFELGLDSIDAIKLSSRLKTTTGLHVPVSKIMQDPTCKGIAIHATQVGTLSEMNDENASSYDLIDAQRAFTSQHHATDLNYESILPVTPLQETMIAEMISSDYKTYFNHSFLQLSNGVNIDKLEQAWQAVVDQTPMLRASFHVLDDFGSKAGVIQVVHKPGPLAWRKHVVADFDHLEAITEDIRLDLSASAGKDAAALRLTLLQSYASDASTDRPDSEKSLLVLSVPHAMYDGWSINLLHQDVEAAYSKTLEPRPNFTASLANVLHAAESEESKNFWQDQIEDFTPTGLPKRSHRYQPHERRVYRAELPSYLPLAQILAFCKSQNITLNALTQTAWSLLLATKSQCLDVAFGVVVSGRHDDKEHQMFFPLMNTVVVRCLVHGNLNDMLRYVQEMTSAISVHDRYPLRKVQDLGRYRGKPLFDTLFINQKRLTGDRDDMSSLYSEVGGASNVEYPVCVEAEPTAQSLIWRAACQDQAFSDDETPQLLRDLDWVLQQIITKPDAQTVEYHDDGSVSICNLPPFKEASLLPDNLAPEDYNRDNQPKAATLSTVRKVLAIVSKVEQTDITDNSSIYAIGLDSISAIKVSSLLRKEFHYISVSEILRAETVTGIATFVQTNQQAPNGSDVDSQPVLEDIVRSIDLQEILQKCQIHNESEIEAVMPATPGQVYMMSMQQNSGIFFPTFKYQLQGPEVSLEKLQQAWRTLVAQHSILRTVFVSTAQTSMPWVQLVLRDLDNIPFEDSPSNNLDDSREVLMTPFSPFVALYASRDASTNLLSAIHLRVHHALYDATTLHTLVTRFSALLQPHPPPYDPSLGSLSYQSPTGQTYTTDHNTAAHLTSIFSSSAIAERKTFWTEYLAAYHPPEVTARPPVPEPRELGERIAKFRPSLLTQSTTGRLISFARSKSITPAALLLAAYALVHFTTHPASTTPVDDKAADFLVGVYTRSTPTFPTTSSSNEPQSTNPTLNIVPLLVRHPLSTDSSTTTVEWLIEMARQIQRDLIAIQQGSRAAVSVRELAEWLGRERAGWGVTFNFLIDSDSDSDSKSKKDEEEDLPQSQIPQQNTTGIASLSSTDNSQPVTLIPSTSISSSEGSTNDAPPPTSTTQPPTPLTTPNPLQALYTASTDIEARINPQTSSLDLGIFGWEGMVSVEELEGVVSAMGESLGGAVGVDVDVDVDM
ncbi:MAG: NRPS [Chrysothrix sp. TS-e1954]|nr:MAG: NRPS [Chrysothrix sp. TS-e1954]